MSTKLPWFRLYHRIIDDEKIRLLAFEDRWHFLAICCLMADGLLDEPESLLKERKIAVKMGVQTRELEEIRRRLHEVGLIGDNMKPTAWARLQYQSDTSTDRVRKFRKKNAPKRYRNVSETPPETETETETETQAEIESERHDAVSVIKRGTRLPNNWTPDEAFAIAEGLSASECAREAARFRDYWQAQPGQRGVKLNWDSVWRNWIRKCADGKKALRRDPVQEAAYRNLA